MRTTIWNAPWLWLALALTGCPAEEEGTAGTETDSDGSSGTSAATASTTMAMSTSTTASTTATGSTTDEPTSSEVTGEPSTGTTGDASSGSSSGELDPCAELGREECGTTEGCMPIVCGEYRESPAGSAPWCLGEPAFIGCRSADLECAMEPTTTCEGDDAPIYRCREDCIPAGFIPCEPPVDGDVPACMG